RAPRPRSPPPGDCSDAASGSCPTVPTLTTQVTDCYKCISVRIRCALVVKRQRDWGRARHLLAVTDLDDLRAADRRAAGRRDREARRSDAADRRDEPPAWRGWRGPPGDSAALSARSR